MSIISANFLNHRGKSLNFRWKLLERNYSLRWLQVMNKWKSDWPSEKPVWNEKWFVGSTVEDFDELFEQVLKKVREIDTLGVYKISSDSIKGAEARERLNEVHRAFHEYVETFEIDTTDRNAVRTLNLCHELNDLVHLAESAYQNSLGPFQSLCIIGTGKPHVQTDYKIEDYAFCSPSRVSGWLYIGYATPGKTLFQCFEDNDVDVVRRKLVRPSQGIANEFHLELNGRDTFDSVFESEIRRKYYDWCDKIGAADSGYDCRTAIHNAGRIPLAEPLDNINQLVHHIGGRQGQITELIFE